MSKTNKKKTKKNNTSYSPIDKKNKFSQNLSSLSHSLLVTNHLILCFLLLKETMKYTDLYERNSNDENPDIIQILLALSCLVCSNGMRALYGLLGAFIDYQYENNYFISKITNFFKKRSENHNSILLLTGDILLLGFAHGILADFFTDLMADKMNLYYPKITNSHNNITKEISNSTLKGSKGSSYITRLYLQGMIFGYYLLINVPFCIFARTRFREHIKKYLNDIKPNKKSFFARMVLACISIFAIPISKIYLTNFFSQNIKDDIIKNTAIYTLSGLSEVCSFYGIGISVISSMISNQYTKSILYQDLFDKKNNSGLKKLKKCFFKPILYILTPTISMTLYGFNRIFFRNLISISENKLINDSLMLIIANFLTGSAIFFENIHFGDHIGKDIKNKENSKSKYNMAIFMANLAYTINLCIEYYTYNDEILMINNNTFDNNKLHHILCVARNLIMTYGIVNFSYLFGSLYLKKEKKISNEQNNCNNQEIPLTTYSNIKINTDEMSLGSFMTGNEAYSKIKEKDTYVNEGITYVNREIFSDNNNLIQNQ